MLKLLDRRMKILRVDRLNLMPMTFFRFETRTRTGRLMVPQRHGGEGRKTNVRHKIRLIALLISAFTGFVELWSIPATHVGAKPVMMPPLQTTAAAPRFINN